MLFEGNASGYLSSEIDVSDDQLTLEFTVQSDFASGDDVIINHLSIVSLTAQGPTKLRLIVDGKGDYETANSQSEETITVGNTQVELLNTTAFSVGDPFNLSTAIVIWEDSPHKSLIRRSESIYVFLQV